MHEANTCTADQTVPRKFLLQTVAVQVEKYMLSSESKLIVAADAVHCLQSQLCVERGR